MAAGAKRQATMAAVRTSKVVGAEQTLDFVCGSLRPCTLVEVGCGGGELAALLLGAGFQIVGVDSDSEAVAVARDRGVEAVCADFLEFECPPVAAVLFSRSLHHMDDPLAALRHARDLLLPNGELLVEDFGPELVDLAAATWLYDLMVVAAEICGKRFCPVDDPLANWRADHPEHHIHPAGVLDDAIRNVFEVVDRQSAPYLYRYIADLVGNGTTPERLVGAVMRWETRQIGRGRLPAVGQRWHCR